MDKIVHHQASSKLVRNIFFQKAFCLISPINSNQAQSSTPNLEVKDHHFCSTYDNLLFFPEINKNLSIPDYLILQEL